jgi:hypothetical protein
MDALLRSHHELRAAVRLAGQKIVKLNFGRRTDPVFRILETRTPGSADRGEGLARAAEAQLNPLRC